MRMNDERVVKTVVLGWYEGLECESTVALLKKKTMLYRQKLLRESGVDWTGIELRTNYRKEWKRCVRKRMKRVNV